MSNLQYEHIKLTIDVDDATFSIGWRNTEKSKNNATDLIEAFKKVSTVIPLLDSFLQPAEIYTVDMTNLGNLQPEDSTTNNEDGNQDTTSDNKTEENTDDNTSDNVPENTEDNATPEANKETK